ncbi:2-C-methyl-D-erythritol 4-phosphate cytidylyltransferase [Prevotella sp. PCHR]|uniref:2-C-methyl-D-erythritol 4-phosphate cytidylyltransferase n=1 Tax=Xylanibacter caecicola TaxID=2736294 RepID=A0ABX2B6Y5_9BACT|nr:IspD/TarI family cytidylyltransferase [Xylanibacter caecicola]NPE25745.1 2-C-methyl-D-erythritol 4-phosphate cytidylyltransferase [Xylanibacter caecicola]
MNIALIIAGGVGARMGQDIPKQFINVYDKPIILYTMEAFQKHPDIDSIEVVCLDGWHDILRAYARQFGISKLEGVVSGGKNGQDSIRNGLYDIASRHNDENDIVLIHDAIRPMLSQKVIDENLKVCREKGNAITVIPCNAAMLKTFDGVETEEQVPRDNLKETQTPQTFYLKDIIAAHKEALERGITNSVASCTMYIELGKKLYMSTGAEKNLKLTTTEDIEIFKALLNAKKDSWMH